MARLRIFISSVQKEFAKERKALAEYLLADPLLGRFFDPFIFEQLPAVDQRADQVYLHEVSRCDIYLGILGKKYGSEDKEGISPTEREFDHASKLFKTRLIFLSANEGERNTKQEAFIQKVQGVLVRKSFSSLTDLKAVVYASLVRVLFEKEIIRSGPFDTTFNEHATLGDIDPEKIKWFIRIARSKRGFPFREEATIKEVLTHLNLMEDERIRNAALLLFAKQPQRFFINSEVRCAHYHGTEVQKPIPSYKVFKGNVFELVDQSLDFVLSKLDYTVGTRKKSAQAPGSYEIPKEIIAEAIVNSIAHRDYTSNASVQIMLFSDRMEIWNPGELPLGWTTEKLKKLHTSVPANPLLAEPMYLAAYIERMGTGTSDMVKIARKNKLAEPEFIQEDAFIVKVFRPKKEGDTPQIKEQVREQVKEQVREQVTEQIKKLLNILDADYSVAEIMNILHLKGRRNFIQNYLNKAIHLQVIEMTQPDSPNSPTQKYRLTPKGKKLQQALKKK